MSEPTKYYKIPKVLLDLVIKELGKYEEILSYLVKEEGDKGKKNISDDTSNLIKRLNEEAVDKYDNLGSRLFENDKLWIDTQKTLSYLKSL